MLGILRRASTVHSFSIERSSISSSNLRTRPAILTITAKVALVRLIPYEPPSLARYLILGWISAHAYSVRITASANESWPAKMMLWQVWSTAPVSIIISALWQVSGRICTPVDCSRFLIKFNYSSSSLKSWETKWSSIPPERRLLWRTALEISASACSYGFINSEIRIPNVYKQSVKRTFSPYFLSHKFT